MESNKNTKIPVFKCILKFFILILLLKNCRYNEIGQDSAQDAGRVLANSFIQSFYDTTLKSTQAPTAIYGFYADSTRILISTDKAAIFESTNSTTFTRTNYSTPYNTQLGDCKITVGYPKDNCKIIGVGFENNNYYLIGQVINDSYNFNSPTASKNKFYYLKTPTLGTGTFTETLTGTAEYQSPSFIVKNSIMHLSLQGLSTRDCLFFR